MAISNEQKALIHVAKAQLGLDDDLYRAILYQVAGVYSCKDLNDAGFDRVMRRFRSLGFRRHRQVVRHPFGVITQEQNDLIQHLYEDLGWYEKKRQIGFNQRVCKKPWPQTRADANKVIEGLKAMLARKGGEKGAGTGGAVGTAAGGHGRTD